MPIYGIRTQKLDGERPEENRYYTSQSSLTAAMDVAEVIANIEKEVFSNAIDFANLHVWQVGASPRAFINQPVSFAGEYDGTNALAPEIVLRVIFGTESSNNNYKDYRVRPNSNSIVGTLWSATYLSAALTALEALDELRGGGDLVTKTGAALTSMSVVTRYEFHQLHPRWYNKTPSTP